MWSALRALLVTPHGTTGDGAEIDECGGVTIQTMHGRNEGAVTSQHSHSPQNYMH